MPLRRFKQWAAQLFTTGTGYAEKSNGSSSWAIRFSDWVGPDYFRNVTIAQIPAGVSGDAQLIQIGRLMRLEFLSFKGAADRQRSRKSTWAERASLPDPGSTGSDRLRYS